MPVTEDRIARPLISSESNRARASAAVSAGFLLTNVFGGLLALLIVVIAGEGPRTDGFLAAYSLYLTFLLFGSTLRIGLVPLLGSTSDEGAFRRLSEEQVARLVAVTALVCAAALPLAPLLGRAVAQGAAPEARETASLTLAILSLAAFCQVWSAALSAVLGAARRFAVSAALYTASSIVTVAVAAGLMALIGIEGAPIGILAGAASLLAGHLAYTRSFGFVPHLSWSPVRERASWRLVGQALAAAAIPVALQLSLTISLAAVSSEVGAITAYTYAYLFTVVLTGVTASSVGLVTMPDLVTSLEQRGREAAREYLRIITPFGVYLYVPLAAGYAAFGNPLVSALLSADLSDNTFELLWDLSRLFVVMGLAWTLLVTGTTAALSLRLYRQLLMASLAVVGVHALAVTLVDQEGTMAVGVVQVCSSTLLLLLPMALVFGGRRLLWAVTTAVRTSIPALLLAVVYPLLAATGLDNSVPGALAGLCLGTVLYLGLAAALWPSVGRQAFRLLLARA
jgi:peptidoglycan biosynthesis protein MviN/MurJ (putative lipid II flippase)